MKKSLILHGTFAIAMTIPLIAGERRWAGVSEPNGGGTAEDEIVLRGHSNIVSAIAWSPDGKRLATASGQTYDPAQIKVWDADGTELVTIWGMASDRERRTGIGGPAAKETSRWFKSHATSLAWHPDGKTLASGHAHYRESGVRGTVMVWDAATGRQLNDLGGHLFWVTRVAWSRDGRLLASTSLDAFRIWDLATARQVWSIGRGSTGNPVDLKIKSNATSIDWSPDGRRVAWSDGDREITVFDVESQSEVRKLRGHTDTVSHVAWNRDGTRLASASNDQTIRVWNATSGEEVCALRGPASAARWVAWSPNGNRLASGGADAVIRIWDIESGTALTTLPWAGRQPDMFVPGTGFSWSSNGLQLAIANRIWDVAANKEILLVPPPLHPFAPIALSPDGRRVAYSSNGTVTVSLIPGESL